MLDHKKKYLQVALNGTLLDAQRIISQLPVSDRIIIEAGTPFIKHYGIDGIRKIKAWAYAHAIGGVNINVTSPNVFSLIKEISQAAKTQNQAEAYVVADLKMMDRGSTEVELAANAGANAAVALGHAPTESLNAFIAQCEALGLDSMIDMMNVEYPLAVLNKLKKQPHVVILHRGVDEEKDNREKQIPLHEIRRIKSRYNTLIAIAGGDTIREVQRAIFNDADIVVVWKNFYESTKDTKNLAEQFLREIK